MRAYLKDPPGEKERIAYGQRWMAETFFSGFKWLWGEEGWAKGAERMAKEIELKLWVHNPRLGPRTSPALSAVEG